MVAVVSHANPLTGGAIQPSGQVTDLDGLIGQQESQILRARGRAVFPPLDLHSLIMDLGLQSLDSDGAKARRSVGDIEGLTGGVVDGALPGDVLVRFVGDMRHVEEGTVGRAGTLGVEDLDRQAGIHVARGGLAMMGGIPYEPTMDLVWVTYGKAGSTKESFGSTLT
ncbi:hypothetical protein PInf_024929 [Phytophthora infestans]|nr:hypothetical protein PInf_024929 [Phytophthora infestans]